MIILPAIDMLDQRPVRLYQGDYSKKTQVSESILGAARAFENDGATWLHMVDLDGARLSSPVNVRAVQDVLRHTELNVEIGGGIRSLESIDLYMRMGVKRVILGTSAVSNRALLQRALDLYGEAIAVGIDAKDDKVRISGWYDDTGINYLDFALDLKKLGVSTIIATDITKDGTLAGPSLLMYERLLQLGIKNVIASGGIKDISDIKRLKHIGVAGAICGKSLYEGTLDLRAALDMARS